MRVLFIWLNHDCPTGFSSGIAVLSAELKAAGHAVELLHVNEALGLPYDVNRIVTDVARRNPEAVALSFGTNHAPAAAEIAHRVKQTLPRVWVIAGGIHATLDPEAVSGWSGIDIVAVGEADDGRFAKLIDDLATGQVPRGRAGFWLCRGENVEKTLLPPPVDLTKQTGTMDLELFDHRRILQLKKGWADVHTGRGCPHRCSYCCNESLREKYIQELGLQTYKGLTYVRRRTVEAVLHELRRYRELYGDVIRFFSFTDDHFLAGKEWCCRFFDAYAAEFNIPLVFMSTADAIDRDIADRCARAGTFMVRIGVESGSDRLREHVLNRRTPSRRICQAFATLHDVHINVWSYNMLGIPGETMCDVWSTFRFAVELRCDVVRFSIFWPYPGTRLHQLCVQEKLIRDNLGFLGNNLSDTPLTWPQRQQRFYGRVSRFYDVGLNRFLCAQREHEFAELLDKLESMSDEAWQDGGSSSIRARADRLVHDVLTEGGEAFTAPAPGRFDILVLQSRQRMPPLVM